ncbi:MAG TPA: hypothetical protein VNE62_09050 [Actinomycetota bacterium]|nr:hypothetical protein [Actinomycetota bacterium]
MGNRRSRIRRGGHGSLRALSIVFIVLALLAVGCGRDRSQRVRRTPRTSPSASVEALESPADSPATSASPAASVRPMPKPRATVKPKAKLAAGLKSPAPVPSGGGSGPGTGPAGTPPPAAPTPAPPAAQTRFMHRAVPTNITDNYTVIDHEASNGNPNAIVYATQVWNPGGGAGIYNNKSIGVWYTSGFWAIFNEDGSAMPNGAAFSVDIRIPGASTFVHQAAAANIDGGTTFLDHESVNGNANAVLIVTQNWNPGGSTNGVYNNSAIGVYIRPDGKWAILNEDLTVMPEGASFNVQVHTAGDKVLVHKSSSSNVVGNTTWFESPASGDSDALLFVTQNWNPGGSPDGVYNDKHVGVTIREDGKWAVFNEDESGMAHGAGFNIRIV